MHAFLHENFIEIGSALAGLITAVVGGFAYFSGKKSEKADFVFSVDASYERVWSKHNGNPALKRVTLDEVDLEKHPVTLEEERFVLLLLNHVTSTLKAVELGTYEKPEGMEADIIEFFCKPIPSTVAKKFFEKQSKGLQELLKMTVDRR